MPSLDDAVRFMRERTAPAPVPLVPELVLFQATELTPPWRATASELPHAWDDSPRWAFPWTGGQAEVASHDVPKTVEIENRPTRRARAIELLPWARAGPLAAGPRRPHRSPA